MFKPKPKVEPTTYMSELMASRDEKAIAEYEKYIKQHQAKLRRLEREQRGEAVPEDWYSDETFSGR